MNVGEAIERMCEIRDRYNKTLCSLPPKTRERSDYNNDIDAFLLAIEALEKQLPKKPDADNDWIPCSERLPEDGTYLCTLDGELLGEQEPFTGMCGIKNGKWDEEGCVIAWKPLPEPYKQN